LGTGAAAAAAAAAAAEVEAEVAEAAEEVTHAFALLCCAFCSRQLPELCGAASASSESLDLMGLLMALTAHPLRRVALLTQDVWLELADMRLDERHEVGGWREPAVP